MADVSSLEVIEISDAIEQNLSVSYGSRRIVFELRYNETRGFWYLNIKENDSYIAYGITMTVNSNLLYDKWQLGRLYLIDTETGVSLEPITKSDLGQRLALMREFTA